MPRNSVGYDDDFFAWTEEQARLLRTGELGAIDTVNLAEEIESVGRSDRREIRSRLTVLLIHLLKWRFQADGRSSSWSGTINEQRERIELVIEDSPSLRPFATEIIDWAYERARAKASEETNMPESTFPAECPFTLEQILSPEFLPED